MKTTPKQVNRNDSSMRILTIKFRRKPPTVENIKSHFRVDRSKAEEMLGYVREYLAKNVMTRITAYLEGSTNIEPPGPNCEAIGVIYEELFPEGMFECQRFECEGGPDQTICVPQTED